MSIEAARVFVQAILDDEELSKRAEKMKPEDAVPLGKEMGYDFTLEEFTDVMNEDGELSPDELEAAAGGGLRTQENMRYKMMGRTFDSRTKGHKQESYNREMYCNSNPSTPHQFIVTYEDRSYFFGAWTKTYEINKCSVCHYEREYHIKFGEGGKIEYVD
ncbi:MAG: Nif11-like leader peptide family RiPP precursor [Ruminiclostridium sp.]|nr:Nif11-like leader peptide family RiPP precursor [Ruminiclostridium sp.]